MDPPKIGQSLERTLFILEWAQNPGLRQRLTAGLNKGEARNAPARAVFFNRLGEIRDRAFEQQNYRASGLTLLTAAIVYWNTIYTDHAIQNLNSKPEQGADPDLLRHLSPLAGNTSTSPETTPGATPPNPASSGPYAPHQNNEATDH